MKKVIVFLAFVLLSSYAYAADIVYVQSVKANIVSSPAFSANVEGVALKGDKLEVLDKNNGWYKVNYKGKTGWVSKLLVSPNPPMDKVTVLAGKDDTLEKEARRRASTMTTAAAARGLADEDRARLSQRGFADYDALKKIDSLKVDEKEAQDFLEQRR